MTARRIVALMLAILPSTPALAREVGPLEFAVRADLSQAEAIAPVLARIGAPVLYPVAAGADPAAAVAEACGVPPPPVLGIRTEPTASGTIATFASAAPCVRRLRNVTVQARDGDTLETIAVRLGMRQSSSGVLRVRKEKSALRRQMRTGLSRGDSVTAALAPDWSVIRPLPGTVSTRRELVEQIANAMKCGAEEVNSCLLRRSVLVTERTPSVPKGVLQSRAMAALQPEVDDGGTSAAPPNSPPLPESAVAPGQWPYDAELVKLLLKEAADRQMARSVLIGVADNGLSDSAGRPLAAGLFGKTYDTGGIGAGAPRNDRARGGLDDVSLCDKVPDPPFARWPSPGLENASHGAIVSSIATGQGLRSDATAAALPRLVFYRTVRNGCTAESGLEISENDLIDAAEALSSNDIKVLNMSVAVDAERSINLVSRLSTMLVTPSAPVLVVAAGNFTGNLDDPEAVCPGCLGNPDRFGAIPRYRILTVGAAERSLRRADFSGHGDKTVRIYAPGDPSGAIDIDGQDASAYQSATSYATPLVSLAVGIAYALGMEDAAKIRNRLLLASWPLLGDDGKPVGKAGGPLDIGVVDLVRVAALHHTSIETIQPGPDGRPVRRVYVGRIVSGLDRLCEGTKIDELANQAIRFGELDANGNREATLALFKPDRNTFYPPTRQVPCASSGALTIEALRDGIVTVPASSVTQILLPLPAR